MALLFSGSSFAAFLKNVPVKLKQPDGAVLNVYATGDEYYYRLHDAENYSLTRDPLTGYYVYASIVNDELTATDYIVGEINPHFTELQPGVCISSSKWAQLRSDYWENTPAKASNGISGLGPLSSGTIKNIVVYIRFSDQSEFTNNVAYYDAMFNNTAPTANSMYNYFKEASFSSLFITSSYFPTPQETVIVSYQDSHPRDYYVPFDTVSNLIGYHDNERTSREHALLANSINAIAGMVPAGLNIDHDNDGYVDNVCFIINGGTTDWSTLLWPHRWALYSQSVYINSKQVWDYNLQLDDFLTGSGNGVLSHEMFHTLGAPDLYHYEGNGISPVGGWDIMESNANPPQSMGAYMKYQYGNWINSIPAITSSGTYTLNPVTSSTNNCYKLYSPYSTDEFFVFEYRRKTGTFESSLPGSGLLIYRINTTAGAGNAGGPPDEVYVFRPGGTPDINGTVDLANFSSESGRTELNNTSNPYGFFADGSLANIDISNVTSALGNTISFTVNVGTAANFQANKTSACPGTPIIFTDQSIGLPTTWLWSFTPNTVTYVDGTNAASQNPHVQFNAAGQYSVSLTATGPGGSNTKTKTNYISILNLQSLPFADDFETNSFATHNWTVENPDNAITWALTTVGGTNPGSNAAFMNFFNYGSQGQTDVLVSPPINLTGINNPKLTFKVAYRQYSGDYKDTLKVEIYSNCGDTYLSTPYTKTGLALATGPASSNNFTPSVAADWRSDTVSLAGLTGNIIIKFKALNDYGNNLFIDNINVSGSTPLSANFTGTPTTLCAGGTVSFTDQSIGSPTSWLWNFGDGGTSTLQNPTHIYAAAGQYSVTLTSYKSGNSNTIVKTNYITVNPVQQASVSISQLPSGPVCQGTLVTLTATATNPGLSPVYQWKKNGGNVGANSSTYASSLFSNGDAIQCVLTSSAGCLVSNPVTSSTVTIVVNHPVVNLGNDTLIFSGSSIQLNAGAGFPTYFWSTGQTTQTITVNSAGSYSVSVTDNNGCSGSDNITIGYGLATVSGNISYLNSANTHLDSTTVILKLGNTVVQQTTTDGAGNYSFTNLAQGSYNLVSGSAKKWGGVNSVDALLIMKHFVGITLLSGLKMKAASTDLNPVINSIDALMVQKRSVGLINSFPAGDWTYTQPVVQVITPSVISQNINGLVVGDVNGSYIPATKTEPSVALNRTGESFVAKDDLFTVPLTIDQTCNAGAISLDLGLPSGYKLLDVNLPSVQKGNFIWNRISDRVLISWYDIDALEIKAGETLINLTFQKETGSKPAEQFLMSISSSSEIADIDANILKNVVISYPDIVFDGDNQGIENGNFPNPFNNSTTIWFKTREDANVGISVYSIEGVLIRTLFSGFVTAGEHRYLWDGSDNINTDLPSGIYYYQLTVNNRQTTRKIARIHN